MTSDDVKRRNHLTPYRDHRVVNGCSGYGPDVSPWTLFEQLVDGYLRGTRKPIDDRLYQLAVIHQRIGVIHVSATKATCLEKHPATGSNGARLGLTPVEVWAKEPCPHANA